MERVERRTGKSERYDGGDERFTGKSGRSGGRYERFSGKTDRFGGGDERFTGKSESCGGGNERFSGERGKFGGGHERFTGKSESFGGGNEKFSEKRERFGRGDERFTGKSESCGGGNERFSGKRDRFGGGDERFTGKSESCGGGNERFSRKRERFGGGDKTVSGKRERFGGEEERFSGKSQSYGGGDERVSGKRERFDGGDARLTEKIESFGGLDGRFSVENEGFGEGEESYTGKNQKVSESRSPGSSGPIIKPPRRPKVNKKPRLIVRNLSFKVTEENLKKYFSSCGEVKEVNVLKKPDGKLVGCAFIQYNNVHEALKAMQHLNMKEFLGRPIAIDWALPKKVFQGGGRDVNEELNTDATPTEDVKVKEEPMDDYETKPREEQQPEIECDDAIKNEISDDDNDDERKEDDSEHDNENEEKTKRKYESHDAEEGKTLFLRNLDFEATEQQLKDLFTTFGDVQYALLCKDKLTEHPKGTGFVKFRMKESADKCLDKVEEDPLHFIIGRRQFYISAALTKQNLETKLAEGKKKIEKDNRNLFLAREGFVRPGSVSAEGVSAADMSKRAVINQAKKQMLKNLNTFVSRTRLCIHNLPTAFSDKELKEMFLKHGGKGAKVTEARVMRDDKNVSLNGLGASKGFGFITFADHSHALQALRSINNNPGIIHPNQRPIVEFSLENKAALKAKEKRLEKSKRMNVKEAQVSTNKEPDKKKSKKRKPKRIEAQSSTGPATKNRDERNRKLVKNMDEQDWKKPTSDSQTQSLEFSGLKAKFSVKTLPSMKPKGKISRNSLKPTRKMKNREMKLPRRMRQPKTRPKNKNSGDNIDKLVSRLRKESAQSVKTNRKRWFK